MESVRPSIPKLTKFIIEQCLEDLEPLILARHLRTPSVRRRRNPVERREDGVNPDVMTTTTEVVIAATTVAVVMVVGIVVTMTVVMVVGIVAEMIVILTVMDAEIMVVVMMVLREEVVMKVIDGCIFNNRFPQRASSNSC